MATSNLWPPNVMLKIEEAGPYKILKEQAELLSDMTNGLVTAEVRSSNETEGTVFVDDFYLVGPKLNYRYLLFSVQYAVDDYYPIRLYEGILENNPVKVEDETKLEEELRRIFAHEKTHQVINSIIERSRFR